MAAARRTRSRLDTRTFEKGECVLRQGDPPPGLFLLRSGLGRVYTSAANGREILHAFVGPGEVLGEIEYFAGEPLGCTVEAARRAEAWFLASSAVDALLAKEPRLAIALATTMARRYHRSVARSSERISYPVADNVLLICLAHMRDHGDPRIQLPKHDLAEYLGTSGRHLNRVLKQLAARGAIELAPGQIRSVDPGVARRLVDDGASDPA
ncbi:MAG TPA: Crp/Fnr family transcriptional regulator [Kofleriaceae bacterium]|nr:Crp/Fnr family transcriptional regulator [Kofleriaceae bacterium]